DEEGLKKATASFLDIVNDLKGKQAAPTPPLLLALAQCYSSLGKHAEAADLLKPVPEPKPEAGAKEADAEATRNYRGCRLFYIRQLRLGKKFKEAHDELGSIMGTPENKKWGLSDIAVLKEELLLLIDEEKFVEGYQKANNLVKALVKRAETNNAMKEHYLEIY